MPKNVLLICTDHWPGSLLGCAGHPVVMTPTLDQLARDGVRFNRFYSDSPVCVPARRSLMTGMYPASHGCATNCPLPMPDAQTLPQAFRDAGYQAYAVGKMHVSPPRARIGFDDVILAENGRYQGGATGDYQIWLGEQGYVGQEYHHGMSNNDYNTRPWHLPEQMHQTNWITEQMVKTILRRDPSRPAFYYLSYGFPHPPLVPLQAYQDKYSLDEIDEPYRGAWADNTEKEICTVKGNQLSNGHYTQKEIKMARRAFYAQCTHIDHQIRRVIGTLSSEGIRQDTVIAFTSDHGDMLFNHGMTRKRLMYEGSANVPFILSGQPVAEYRGTVNSDPYCLSDVMPTLLNLCGIDIPNTVDGISMFGGKKNETVFSEITDSTCMVANGRFKLIYYPVGNHTQLFDLDNDPREMADLDSDPAYADIKASLTGQLISRFYGGMGAWVTDGKLTGLPDQKAALGPNYGLSGQRGGHWPVNPGLLGAKVK